MASLPCSTRKKRSMLSAVAAQNSSQNSPSAAEPWRHATALIWM
jgi:hypothetical protein